MSRPGEDYLEGFNRIDGSAAYHEAHLQMDEITDTTIPIPQMAVQTSGLPTEPKARKQRPIASGVLDYFPDALAEIAHVSFVGNEQHNPGQPLHWDRTKSTDHADCIMRHLMQRGTLDTDGLRHSAKVAWRALALLQVEIEKSKQNKETDNG